MTDAQKISQKCVKETVSLARDGKSVLLAMGHTHDISHAVADVLALKELAEKGHDVTLFVMNPHNRLYTILLDRGYDTQAASEITKHLTANDPKGHILPKAAIGGSLDPYSRNTTLFMTQLVLQAAILHECKVSYMDAARDRVLYRTSTGSSTPEPAGNSLDYRDSHTREVAEKIKAQIPPDGEMGRDDVRVRNTLMAEIMKAELARSQKIGLAHIGAGSVFGLANKGVNNISFADSIANKFQILGLPAVMVNMVRDFPLPTDYRLPRGDQHKHVFTPLNSTGFLATVSDKVIGDFVSEIDGLLAKHGLEPKLYNPRYHVAAYKAEFETAIKEAGIALGNAPPAQKNGGRLGRVATLDK